MSKIKDVLRDLEMELFYSIIKGTRIVSNDFKVTRTFSILIIDVPMENFNPHDFTTRI